MAFAQTHLAIAQDLAAQCLDDKSPYNVNGFSSFLAGHFSLVFNRNVAIRLPSCSEFYNSNRVIADCRVLHGSRIHVPSSTP